jgi:hypothetical protein
MLSGDSTKLLANLQTAGKLAGKRFISASYLRADSIVSDTNVVNAALSSLATAQAQMENLPGIRILGDTLKDTTLAPGVYLFSGNAWIKRSISLSNTLQTYVFNIEGNANFEPGCIMFTEGRPTGNIYWNVKGNAYLKSGAHVLGNILSHGNIESHLSVSYDLSFLAQENIRIHNQKGGLLKSPNKLLRPTQMDCTPTQDFCELLIDGNFESAIPDQTDCPSKGDIYPRTVCELTNGPEPVIRWTCCNYSHHEFRGPLLSHQPTLPIGPTPGTQFPDPNPECNYAMEMYAHNPIPDNVGPELKTSLTQPLTRAVGVGRYRFKVNILIHRNMPNPIPARFRMLAGLVPQLGDCKAGDDFIEHFGNTADDLQLYVNELIEMNTSLTNPIFPEEQWVSFCGEFLVTADFGNECFWNLFSLNFILENPNPNGDAIGYQIYIDNLSLTSLQPCQTITVPNFCFAPGLSINLNDAATFAPGVPQGPGGGWFLINGNNQSFLQGGIFNPPGPGIYNIRYQVTTPDPVTGNLWGCIYHQEFFINILPPGTANAGPDRDVCFNQSRVASIGTPAGGTWSGPGVEQDGPNWFFNPALPGVLLQGQANTITYSVPQSTTTCAASDNLIFRVWGIVGNIGLSQRICLGESATVQFQGAPSQNGSFLWFASGITFTSDPILPTTQFENDPSPYEAYTITPGQAVQLDLAVVVLDNNAPAGLSGCINASNAISIEVLDLDPNFGCCAHTPLVNEGPNVIVNENVAPGTLQRGEIGTPGPVTVISCPNEEERIFDGKYLINGSLRLSTQNPGESGTFIIREGSELLINTLQGESYESTYGCLFPARSKSTNRIQIYVDPGVTLILQGCTLKAACGEMWKGIDVPQGASLVAQQGLSGRRNRIEDAVLGIAGHNTCNLSDPYQAYNSILQIDRTDFVNCMIGLGDYSRIKTNTQAASNINHCTFSSNRYQMKRPFVAGPSGSNEYYYGLAGIEFTSFSTLPQVSAGIFTQSSSFNNLMVGIMAANSDLNSSDCNFDYCYRAGIAKSNFTLGFPTNLERSFFNIARIKINVPGDPFDNQVGTGPFPFGFSSSTFNLNPNQTSFGIRTYLANLNIDQFQDPPGPGDFTYYIKGDLNRPANRKAVGILADLEENQEVGIQKNYFYNLTEALSFTRRQESTGDLAPCDITGNFFEDNRTAIRFAYSNNNLGATTSLLDIKQNRFNGNQTSIDLDAPSTTSFPCITDFTLKCNRFDRGNSNFGGTYVGLKLSNAHRLKFDAIGGDGSFDFPKSPGANIWPINGNPSRVNAPCPPDFDVEKFCGSSWQSPTNWNSIQNNTNIPISVWRYKNEFVGVNGLSVTKGIFNQRCYTGKNDPQTIQPGDVQECGSGVADNGVVVFPTRMAVDSTQLATAIEAEKEAFANFFLGQNQPNPGQDEVEIAYKLPAGTKDARISVFSLSGIATLLQFPLSGAEGKLKLSVSQLPAGIYAYSLVADGQSLKTRKLVVIK